MSLLSVMLVRQTATQMGRGLTSGQLRIVRSSMPKWFATTSCMSKAEVLKPDEGFWDKNNRLQRPMSPHLTIYKPQITSMLSITHRGTGLALSGVMSGFAIGMLMLPGSFPYYFGILQSTAFIGPALIFSAKFLLSFPFVFHFANGLRHLAWDLGKGFSNKQVATSGWSVVGVSTLLALGLASM